MGNPIIANVRRPGEDVARQLDLNDDEDLEKATLAVHNHGYIVFEKATTVEGIWDYTVQDLSNHGVKAKCTM